MDIFKKILSIAAVSLLFVGYFFFYTPNGDVSYAVAALAVGLASSLIKGGLSAYMASKAKPDEVQYNIPQEVRESLDISRQRAYGENRSFQTMRENLESQSAVAARRMTEVGGGGAIGGLSKIHASQMAGTRDIDMAEENYQIQAEKEYQRQLQQMAQYKDQEFDVNMLQPNERSWNEYYNQRKAGTEGFMGAMDSIGSIAGMAFNQGSKDFGVDNVLPGGKKDGGGEWDYWLDDEDGLIEGLGSWDEDYDDEEWVNPNLVPQSELKGI